MLNLILIFMFYVHINPNFFLDFSQLILNFHENKKGDLEGTGMCPSPEALALVGLINIKYQ